jgi:hypothetical protein
MHSQRKLAPALILLSFAATSIVSAAGPMGHYIIARKTIGNIASGGFSAPNELKQLLRDADCQRAYCGGAIGPDLVEAKSHYGATADLSMRMLSKARADMKAAAGAKDAKAFAAAKSELAFAYGWFNHFVVDMNVHEQVNGMEGVTDAYSFTTDAQKKTHGVYEGQLTAYLRKTIWNAADKYDVLIPYAFVASEVGVGEPSVRQMAVVLKGKVAGELVFSGGCELSTEQLASIWNRSVTKSLQEIAQCLNSPQTMKNWDMDVGHISSVDFASMRSMVIEINDGKLTSDWGRKYPSYWEAIRSLSKTEQRAKLMELLGKTAGVPAKYRFLLTLNVSSKAQGRADMPSGWQDGYISTWIEIEVDKAGAFSFNKTVKGMGGMSTDLTGSGVLATNGLLTMQCTISGGRTYKDRYGNGPEFRCVQADKGSFTLSGKVTFNRNSSGKVYGLDYAQSQFAGSFESVMSLTKVDDNGADLPTETHKCSGDYSPKSSGIEAFDIKK